MEAVVGRQIADSRWSEDANRLEWKRSRSPGAEQVLEISTDSSTLPDGATSVNAEDHADTLPLAECEARAYGLPWMPSPRASNPPSIVFTQLRELSQ